MRKDLLTASIAVLAFTSVSLSQNVPNGGFEAWTNHGSYDTPDSWASENDIVILSNPVSVVKSTPPNSGNFACQITSVKLTNNPDPGVIPDTIGVIFTGTIGLNGVKYGYPSTLKPNWLQFYYKMTPVANDSANVWVVLKKWNSINNAPDTIAIGWLSMAGTVSTYTYKMINLYYIPANMSLTPDSAFVMFSSTRLAKPSLGSQLWVDDVSLQTTGINEINGNANLISVTPNPASSFVKIGSALRDAYSADIYDLLGNRISVYKFENNYVAFSTEGMAEGMYSAVIRDKNGSVLTQKKIFVAR